MPHMPDDDLRHILDTTKTIAIVGASGNPDRPSHDIMAYLQRVGYRTIPINPNEDEVLGEKAYPDLQSIPKDIVIDLVNVFRRPAQTPDVARAAVEIGAKALWLQLGIENDEAQSIAHDHSLPFVQNTCIAVVHRLLMR